MADLSHIELPAFCSIESTCPNWKSAHEILLCLLPVQMLFEIVDDRRNVVTLEKSWIDYLTMVTPEEYYDDMIERIENFGFVMNSKIPPIKFAALADRPDAQSILNTANRLLCQIEDAQVRNGQPSYFQVVQHCFGLREYS